MSSLPEMLDDLATLAPPQVHAGLTWKRGRRRRVRRRLLSGAAAGLALVVVTVVVPALDLPDRTPSFAGSSGAVVNGHPERIGRQWWVRDLPDRPGPLAALVSVGPRSGPDAALFGAGESHWEGVRTDGHRWRMPEVFSRSDVYPTLSPDGVIMGYLAGEDGPYVLDNLATGERIELPDVGDPGVYQRQSTYGLFSQWPAFWSPDRRHVLLSAFDRSGGPSGYLLVDVRTASTRLLDIPSGATYLAGWARPEKLVWLGAPDGRASSLITTTLDGSVTASVPLQPRPAAALRRATQWSAFVQPTTGSVVLALQGDQGEPGTVRSLVLASGFQIISTATAPVWSPCQGAASAHRVVAPVRSGEQASVVEIGGNGVVPFTVFAPSADASCLVWATQAVDAPGRGGGLFGTYDAGWTWWWKEGLLLAAAMWGLVALLRRRRQRPRPVPTAVDWYA